jgi:hypothetical protein
LKIESSPIGIRRQLSIADGYAFLGGLLFFLRAYRLSTPAFQTFSILHLHIVRTFLARGIAPCTARAGEKGHRASDSHEQFHFTDS